MILLKVLLPDHFCNEINIISTIYKSPDLKARVRIRTMVSPSTRSGVVHLLDHSHYAEYWEDLVKDDF